jgi:uncharacterized membrane protein
MNSQESTEEKNDTRLSKYFGIFLIVLAIAGFTTTAIISLTDLERIANGTFPAVSFLVLILGLVFYFPSLLEERKGEISTMRIVVLIVVLVFAVVYIKLGWVAGTFAEFVIDTSWIYILGLAFGSKAFQKFAENDEGAGS